MRRPGLLGKSPNAQFSSVAQSCPTLCDPLNCSMLGLSVHHQLPEFTETHVHQVGDAIQPSHPVVPFSSCHQSLPASESFPMSQLFAWGGQSTGGSALASFLPKKSQGWVPLGWTGWIPLQSKGLSRVFSNTTVQRYQFLSAQLSLSSNSHIHTWLLEKPYLWTRRTFVGKVVFLLFNMQFRLVITFLPRSKHLLISWLQSPSAVILEAPQNKVWHCFHCFPIYFPWSDRTRCHDLRFLNVEF